MNYIIPDFFYALLMSNTVPRNFLPNNLGFSKLIEIKISHDDILILEEGNQELIKKINILSSTINSVYESYEEEFLFFEIVK